MIFIAFNIYLLFYIQYLPYDRPLITGTIIKIEKGI